MQSTGAPTAGALGLRILHRDISKIFLTHQDLHQLNPVTRTPSRASGRGSERGPSGRAGGRAGLGDRPRTSSIREIIFGI